MLNQTVDNNNDETHKTSFFSISIILSILYIKRCRGQGILEDKISAWSNFVKSLSPNFYGTRGQKILL